MHPRSPYVDYVNFAQLAKDCPSLAKYLTGPSHIDFKDPDALRELTKSLLKHHFGLDVELPEDRLCPAVPNRLNYILWIQDLIDSTTGKFADDGNSGKMIVGLDVGTGASCIYPLLGCAQRNTWDFIGTDIDAKSLQIARDNVQRNVGTLGPERIKIFESSPEGDIFPLDALGIEKLDFTMCNPPFYSSIDDLFNSAKQKNLPPSSACTGTTIEMVTPGGELSFAQRMLTESLHLRERISWYTTMFGKLSSVSSLISSLKSHPELSGNWAVGELVQGGTKRWVVAWSFGNARPSQTVVKSEALALKGLGGLSTEMVIAVDGEEEVVKGRVKTIIEELELVEWEWKDCVGVGATKGNVWSRAARRAKARGGEVTGMEVDGEIALRFRLVVKKGEDEKVDDVTVRWLNGRDAVLFESFCGMLKRKLKEGST
ncbi:hypothetical protein RUND412_006500 [Rhizina undulata]